MSWMDSWSRPNKSSATPPPLYLTNEDVKYCVACGRVIGDRKSHQRPGNSVIKYCSDGCRKRRVGPADKRIDRAILALLRGDEGSGIEKIDVKSRMRKGDQRNMITCDEIEEIVYGRQAVKLTGGLGKDREVSEEEEDPYALPDEEAMNSQGNRPNPTGPGDAQKRSDGQKKAEEREMVRRAARRAVVFGFDDGQTAGRHEDELEKREKVERRKCEAVMNGQVVEPSFAKGDWGIRWRE